MESDKIFELIKAEVYKILPQSKVFLFGSRANGDANEESDWDILILTQETPDKNIKSKVHDVVFPISIKISAHIDTIIVSETDWNKNPGYYSLHQSVVLKNMIV